MRVKFYVHLYKGCALERTNMAMARILVVKLTQSRLTD
jgi:hypothetical protein